MQSVNQQGFMIRTIMETSLFSKLERSRRTERVQVPSKAGTCMVSDQNGNVDVASIVLTINFGSRTNTKKNSPRLF
jgi:hypothetical protein